MWVKRFLPQSLFGRFLLIIVIPAVIFPLVATYVFYERHWKSVSNHMHTALAGEVAHLLYSVQEKPLEYQYYVVDHMQRFLAFDIVFEEGALPKEIENGAQNKDFVLLNKKLDHYLDVPFSTSYAEEDKKEIAISLQFLPNQLLRMHVSRKRIENPSTNIFVVAVIITAGILLVLAVLFSKNQIRAITRLADVAEKFGRGEDDQSFKPTGAREVKQVSEAFIKMRDRLKRQINQRLEMLAGISHDLRTPLTRMKLQISMMENSEDADNLSSDVEEMEHMLNEYLDFVRGEGGETIEPLVLRGYLKKLVSGYRLHEKKVSFSMEKDMEIQVRPKALKRCLTNIIDNALRYGSQAEIQVALSEEDKLVTIIINDDGPGIPEEEYSRVFKPFYRMDSSRNSDTGGIGLGLSIARDIVNGHGGEIILGSNHVGGLKVMITLPL